MYSDSYYSSYFYAQDQKENVHKTDVSELQFDAFKSKQDNPKLMQLCK